MYYNKIIQGDTLEVLKTLPEDTFDTIITSPPYWGLRDYGVDGQIGLEKTLDEFIEKLLAITGELKRVLKPTGVMFWNHGDCYGGSGHGTSSKTKVEDCKESYLLPFGKNVTGRSTAKCLMLQNYRLILKMIDQQGWILRNTIIWSKPNAMPSSVKDRFANKYEPVFMLVKNKKYWFDLDAVRKPYTEKLNRWGGDKLKAKGQSDWDKGTGQQTYRDRDMRPNKAGKNPGDVWKIATHPFPEAHFATFPPKLIEPMVKAGCPKWICKKCGKARVRITKPTEEYAKNLGKGYISKQQEKDTAEKEGKIGSASRIETYMDNKPVSTTAQYKTIGWTKCDCKPQEYEAGIVLDPFMGSGTTAEVAKKLGRNYCGIELNKDYIKIAKQRIRGQIRAML